MCPIALLCTQKVMYISHREMKDDNIEFSLNEHIVSVEAMVVCAEDFEVRILRPSCDQGLLADR